MRSLLPTLAAVVVVLLGGSSVATTQQPSALTPEVARILEAARDESRVMEHLDILCNRIGPRLTSSDALTLACEWTRDQFQSYGLDARLEKWGEFPVGFNRGPWRGRIVEPEDTPLTFGTNAWTAGTKGVTRGKAVLAPKTTEELEQIRNELSGAWILTEPSSAGARTAAAAQGPSADFRRVLDAAYAQAGIAGVIRPTRGEFIVTSGNYRITWDALPTIPQIDLVKPQFDRLVALLKEQKSVVLEFDIRNYFKPGPIPLYNVIADIRGTEFPDEYVIVGGHIDSWDGATGAVDNGTGCSTALEAARLLMKAGIRPRRTIRFMLWSGEEQGLLGSRAYVKAHPELLPNISAVLVHDGGTNYLSGIAATPAMESDFERVFAPVKTLNPEMPFTIRKVDGLRAGGGSDHASFLAAGVPGFFWGQSGRANYTRAHHTQHDTYDAAIPEYQRHSSLVIALAAVGLANLDHLLSRENMMATGPSTLAGSRRLMGVQLDELTILEVIPDGVAAKGGLREGDTFLKVDGKPVAGRDDLVRAIQDGGPRKPVVIRRHGTELEVTLDFGGEPTRP